MTWCLTIGGRRDGRVRCAFRGGQAPRRTSVSIATSCSWNRLPIASAHALAQRRASAKAPAAKRSAVDFPRTSKLWGSRALPLDPVKASMMVSGDGDSIDSAMRLTID